MIKRILFFLFFFASVAHAQLSNVGQAPFAIQKTDFPCDAFIESMNQLPEWHVAFLYNTFGRSNVCLNRLIGDSRLKSLEIHLINEACHRNHRCGSYEFLSSYSSVSAYDQAWQSRNPELLRKFKRYVKPVQTIVSNLSPQTQCYISGGLESNLTNRAARRLNKTVRELFPTCKIVWNPLRQSASKTSLPLNGADLIEGHGPAPGVSAPCITNLDGTDIDFSDRPTLQPSNSVHGGAELQKYMQKYANRCELAFAWVVEDNCNYRSSFLDPRKRNCKLRYPNVFEDIVSDINAASATFAKIRMFRNLLAMVLLVRR